MLIRAMKMTQGERRIVCPVKRFILMNKCPVKIYKLNGMPKNMK